MGQILRVTLGRNEVFSSLRLLTIQQEICQLPFMLIAIPGMRFKNDNRIREKCVHPLLQMGKLRHSKVPTALHQQGKLRLADARGLARRPLKHRNAVNRGLIWPKVSTFISIIKGLLRQPCSCGLALRAFHNKNGETQSPPILVHCYPEEPLILVLSTSDLSKV